MPVHEQFAMRAMRGFGAVQSCFGYESQMDKLAAELGMDPVELRPLGPRGTGNTTRGDGVRRGVGYGVSVKYVCKSLG
jgi:CO/xanthine dehydrogenase Mo-binding subunit